MTGFEGIGKIVIIIGVIIVILGVVLVFGDRIPLLGKLPGDIVVKRNNFTFYFPVVTFLVVSAILTLIINLIFRWLGK